MTDFSEKTVLVTGAARGLGRATAIEFARRGASLALVDILEDRLSETTREIEGLGAKCAAFEADVSNREKCRAAVSGAVEAFGRLDVLCNVAGMVRFHHVTDVTQDEWDRLIGVNLSGSFWMSQAAIPHLLETKGNIVNVASQSALMGAAYIVPYSITKGGVLQLTRSMAQEYVHQGIRINAVSPGTMNTEIGTGLTQPEGLNQDLMERYFGMRPPSEPEEVAAVIAFVASDAASAMHGAIVTADGGVTAG
jgi:meso-butanediol dehydrogenase / (S,S)-butanediol dehydrogenase / diacetyl reductase